MGKVALKRTAMAESKGAILVMNRKDECVKSFKTWSNSGKIAKVEIRFKTKDGEKKKLIKEYVGFGETVPLIQCCEAVIKYWPRYDPAKHTLVISGGHNHPVKTKKVETTNGK